MVVRHSLYHRNAMPMKFENKMHVDWNVPKVGKGDAIISLKNARGGPFF